MTPGETVQHPICNQGVGGSSPSADTTIKQAISIGYKIHIKRHPRKLLFGVPLGFQIDSENAAFTLS